MNLGRYLSSKIRGDFRAAQARLRAHASENPADWPEQQLEAVRTCWADAVKDIPYYASLVESGQTPNDIRSWDDFHKIPILTRQILQDRSAEYCRRSGPPSGYSMTAGSTGNPIRFGMNQSDRDLMRIVKLAAWMQFGYTPASRLFLIWGHSHLLGTGLKGKFNHFKRKMSDMLLGYWRVDAYRLNRELCLKYAEELLRYRPLGMIGYASALDIFGRHTSHLRTRFRELGLRFVLATAEPMPNPSTESMLEDLFGCPVVQEYGGAEIGQVAFKVSGSPFEVYSDLVYLECQDATEADPSSNPAMITTLIPRYFPLFRYVVGDALLGLDRLSNGHIRRFDVVRGRLNDSISFADGTSIHSVAIFHCIHQEQSVHSIQMIIKDDGIDILLFGSTPPDTAVESRIRSRLSQVYQPLSKARIAFTEDLVVSRAGKRRWFVDQRTKTS